MGIFHVVMFKFKDLVPPEEVKAQGMTHVFIFEFESEEDREYYLNKDPAHTEFATGVINLIEKLQAVDFTPGEF
ncbi:hypothetical protein Daesc_005638 [Daldinia eschscholtzii]|uniref:Stress-response A/B barrel domain-containing protein n=1 Tax=Daldinia eschscholtzii TaxID=292717 RepID=A0AAX6ML23_9PEZI